MVEAIKSDRKPILIIVMGVSGTGKSTLGSALATSLGMPFIDGDDLHPKSNIEKMSAGQPLTDADREPWLELIRTTAEHKAAEMKATQGSEKVHGMVVGCSALKKYYRDILRGRRKKVVEDVSSTLSDHSKSQEPDDMPTYFVFIKGSREVLLDRMQKRAGHFMKAPMLDSQLSTLESPEGEDGVVVVEMNESTEEQVEKANKALRELYA